MSETLAPDPDTSEPDDPEVEDADESEADVVPSEPESAPEPEDAE